jgi:RNA polymerase sigma-70 factor (ECF subfamily)
VDWSDIVQVTLIEAHRDFGQFTSSTHSALQKWLNKLLRNNLADIHKLYRQAAKRDVGREVPLDSRIKELAQSDSPPPSLDTLPDEYQVALAKLSPDRRELIRLRHIERLTFPEIGERLAKTPEAVRMAYMRAMAALKSEQENDTGSQQ